MANRRTRALAVRPAVECLEAKTLLAVTTINFEGYSNQTFIMTQYRPVGADFSEGIPASFFRTMPERFGGPFPARSGTFVALSPIISPRDNTSRIRVDAVSDAWAVAGGYITGDANVIMTAYTANGIALGSASTGGNNNLGPGRNPNKPLQVISPGISYVEFVSIGGRFALDDFHFDTTPLNIKAIKFEENSRSDIKKSNGNIELTYSIAGGNLPDTVDINLSVYWAVGPRVNDIIAGRIPIVTTPLEKIMGDHVFKLKISRLDSPPNGATHLVAVMDDSKVLLESDENDNVAAFDNLSPDNVSYEVTNLYSPAGRAQTRYEVVTRYLKRYAGIIEDAARKYNVDKIAIAGAIAWEGLQNVSPTIKAVNYGPGKVHPFEPFGKKSVAELVEGQPKYSPLPKQPSGIARMLHLKWPTNSIQYIAAIMNAYSVEVEDAGFDSIRYRPEILTTLYNGSQIQLESAAADLAEKKNRGETDFGENDMMGRWVKNNVDYLEAAFT